MTMFCKIIFSLWYKVEPLSKGGGEENRAWWLFSLTPVPFSERVQSLLHSACNANEFKIKACKQS